MISKREYCLDILQSLSRPGGEGSLLSNQSTDELRPLIHGEIKEGRDYNHIGTIQAQVYGLKLQSNNSAFQGNCFSYECFESSGIWTTVIKTPISRQFGGITQYWVNGDVDDAGNIYTADIGYIYKVTGQPLIKEENVPLYSDGLITSVRTIPSGIKFIRLKRITPTSKSTILHIFGDYPIPDTLLRSSFKQILNYNAIDQRCDLEEISLTLVSLMMTRYYKPKANQILYRDKHYIDPAIIQIIEDNFARLSRLVDYDITSPRYGSIPRYPATYSEPADIYGTLADEKYLNPELNCFADDCFTTDCFESLTNNLLISREVSNRAIAWFLIALCLYSIHINKERYKALITLLVEYLTAQVDVNLSLPTDGWTHSTIYSNSTKVNIHSTSTAVVVTLALTKAYEITEDKGALDTAADVYLMIIKNLRNYSDNLFSESYEKPQSTFEATFYGLLLASKFDRADIAQDIMNFLYSKTTGNYGQREDSFVTDSNFVLVRTSGSLGIMASPDFKRFIKNPSLLSYFYQFGGPTFNLVETLKYNILFVSLFNSNLEKGYNIAFNNILLDQIAVLQNVQAQDRFLTTSVSSAICLLNRNLFDEDLLKFNNVIDVHTLIFNRSITYDKLTRMWPLHYGWVSEDSLSPRGVLGSITHTIARVLAVFLPERNIAERNVYIGTATDRDLDKWGDDLDTPRFNRETDTEYRERLQRRISKSASTKSAIIENLRSIEVESEVYEVWQRLFKYSGLLTSPGDATLGDALLPGNDYATHNVIEVQTNQPFNDEAALELRHSHAAGVKPFVRESLLFNISPVEDNSKFSFLFHEVFRIPQATIRVEEDTDTITATVTLSWDYNKPLYVNLTDAIADNSIIEQVVTPSQNFISSIGKTVIFDIGELVQVLVIEKPEGCYVLTEGNYRGPDRNVNRLVREDGSALLTEDCTIDTSCPNLLLENGGDILLEDGQDLCL